MLLAGIASNAEAKENYEIYLEEEAAAIEKIDRGYENQDMSLWCEGAQEFEESSMKFFKNEFGMFKYSGESPNSPRMKAVKRRSEGQKWRKENTDKPCGEYFADQRKQQIEKEKAELLAATNASRNYEKNAISFQNYLNTAFTFKNNVDVKFSGLQDCTFGFQLINTVSDYCNQGYVTLKSPVENKICYLGHVSHYPKSGRMNYTLGQCSYR